MTRAAVHVGRDLVSRVKRCARMHRVPAERIIREGLEFLLDCLEAEETTYDDSPYMTDLLLGKRERAFLYADWTESDSRQEE